MIFTEGTFLAFLAVTLIVYYIMPKKARWAALLTGSLFFYYLSGFIWYMLVTIASTYIFSRIIERKRSRAIVIIWLVLHMGLLAAVKLPGVSFITEPLGINILLPLGISFYTFQSAGYIIDAYRGKAGIERNPLKLALFVSFFPQVIQGPISRFSELTKTLFAPNDFSMQNIAQGAMRILLGFFKKLVIADRLIAAVVLMSGDTQTYYAGYALLNILLYAVVLYADFTGGIDIAIGAARLFGISVTENFNRPFYSKNIAEYWRRWHITMGSWFRDYVFYPMSASAPMRKFSRLSRELLGNGIGKRLPVYITTIVTWFLTGLWHGMTANFIAWGLANGIVIILSQELKPLYDCFHGRFIRIGSTRWYNGFAVVRTFLLMCVIRSFDIYSSVGETIRMFLSMFGKWNFSGLSGGIGVDTADLLVAAGAVSVLIIIGIRQPREWFERQCTAMRLLLCVLLLCAVLVFGVYGYGYDAAQFIYNQF